MQNSITKVIMFVFLTLFAVGTLQAATKEDGVIDPSAPVYVTLKPFTISMPTIRNGYEVNKALFVGIILRVKDKTQEDLINTYLPEVRSTILMLLLKQSLDELEEESGKLALKEQIKQTVSRFYNETDRVVIDDVLFTDFIVR